VKAPALRRIACVAPAALALAAGGAAWAEAPAGAVVHVGSKSFTESVILGEIATQVVRAAGAEAEHRSGFGGTRLVWNALLRGAIDLYPEYTGTLIQEILAAVPATVPAPDPTKHDEDWLTRTLAERGVGLIGPLGFNNSYAVGVKRGLAARLGLRRLSDLRDHPELRFGFSNEFMSRRDGWPALRDRYGLPQGDVKGIDHDLGYRGIADGAIDAMDLYATDPEIKRDDLVALEDDRRVFPRYDAIFLYRLDLAQRAPGAVDALRRLTGRIDAPAMAAMNARAKLDRVPETKVAADFLRSTLGLNGPPPASVGIARSILRRAVEHLQLVALSLLAAIAVAVPLGVLAARNPRVGQLVLGAVGVVQTIPSLALLVFMIPLLGIGALPAMVALFLYSLLPIVRNTHAGLTNIPPSLRESAEALGLPPGAILRRIELPLASPLILAGIKSAAVINVGTATLGALIGAGGFGQPIFTGIRLDDVGLILQGAVPASLLALLVQGLFDLIERRIVPRGLRLREKA